jgi:hypothetical protein
MMMHRLGLFDASSFVLTSCPAARSEYIATFFCCVMMTAVPFTSNWGLQMVES